MPGSRSRAVMAGAVGAGGRSASIARSRAPARRAARRRRSRHPRPFDCYTGVHCAARPPQALPLAARRAARFRRGPRRLRRRRAPDALGRAVRVPAAETADGRAMRRDRGAGEPRPAGRPQDHDRRRGAAREHAVAQARSAVHPRRRPGPGGGAPGAVCRAARPRAQGPRHRARRSARHRPELAARLRRIQAGRRRPRPCSNRSGAAGAKECPQELAARGVDAAQYTTAAWVADLEAVRAAIGYRSVNLWGGCYGTRVAMEYAAPLSRPRAQHGARRRRAAVDQGLAGRVADARRGARRRVRRVRRRAACRAAHPDLAADARGDRGRLGPRARDHGGRSAHRRSRRRRSSPSTTWSARCSR